MANPWFKLSYRVTCSGWFVSYVRVGFLILDIDSPNIRSSYYDIFHLDSSMKLGVYPTCHLTQV